MEGQAAGPGANQHGEDFCRVPLVAKLDDASKNGIILNMENRVLQRRVGHYCLQLRFLVTEESPVIKSVYSALKEAIAVLLLRNLPALQPARASPEEV